MKQNPMVTVLNAPAVLHASFTENIPEKSDLPGGLKGEKPLWIMKFR